MAKALLPPAARLMVSGPLAYEDIRTAKDPLYIVTLNLSDSDFASLVSGKANAQRLFMGGKLKIKGNIMKATKMEPVLKKAQGKAKL